MVNSSSWNWEPGDKQVSDLGAWKQNYDWVEELHASPDGENIAAVVNSEGEFTACVNGEAWENVFERLWYLRYCPDGRLTGLGADMGEWTMVVDGEPWENKFSAMWGTQFSADGSSISCNFQLDGKYGMALNDKVWDTLYPDANHFTISPDGKHTASAVQTVAMGQAEIFKFQDGTYSVAVDGKAWDCKFVNAWRLAFSKDAKSVAAEVRLNLYDYNIAVDGKLWPSNYQCVWAPSFNPVTGAVVAPVRQAGKWTMAQDGSPFWSGKYFQCWLQQFSVDGKTLAAVVSPQFSRWTVAVNDTPWKTTFGDLVTDLVLSADGSRAAALGKDEGKWSVIVDDKVWRGSCDMAWTPVFSADGGNVAARVRRDGKFHILVNGRAYGQALDQAWDPIFSPDSTKVLIRCVQDGKYLRRVVPVSDI